MWNDILEIARELSRQAEGVDSAEAWRSQEWDRAVETFLKLVKTEDSALRLGDVLRCDVGLSLPVVVIKATYDRLFELGVADVRTRLCYARYLLLHGPEWDRKANDILRHVEEPARLAGIWDAEFLGHHPVFYQSPQM
ncbi:hypothetical protein [Amycolatopsis thermoflava]|uniref:hypothetical protein n=1 Tax=Amycolatopsis thermoflava TaxID=84480 RepID=UPI0011CD9C3B|nr:hypothetical protein [Amycolatopsis thermoflava]